MRIALVAEDYYPQLGGVPEHVHNLALQLNGWGHTATVVSSHMGDYPDAPFVRRVGTSRVIYANGGVSRVTTGWRLRRRLEDLFRTGRYDIVHVHGGLAPTLGLAAPFAAWRVGIPVVATFHSWFARSLGCRVFRRPLQRILDRHAAKIAVSEPVVDANSRYFRADWEVIPNGVNTGFFKPNGRRPTDALTERPRLLFLGRIEPRNGLGTLLDAMPRVLARYPNALLTVAGDGPWRGYYERRARPLGASVKFVGQVFEDRPDYYGSADLYLCPTTIASFGVTLLEAMACGAPMIVSDNLGFRSVIDGGAEALLIPKDDPATWAETTIALLGDPERRAAMSRAGLEKAERFAWPRIAGAELAVYERVLGAASTGRSASAGTRSASAPRYVREPRNTSVIASTSR
jgi:phosphatidyl-myo-inositol alpha-mannosyltransferase